MNRLLLTSTALVALGSMGHAQDVSYRQLGQLMTVTGGNDQAAFAIGPEWSEELGFSVTGRAGFMLGQGAALGVIGEIGENVTEGMVNLGFNLSDDMAMILTAGQLSERLLVGDTGEREWIAQDEFGLAISGQNLAFNAYYVDSASTENFTGAITYGAEIEGSTDFADNAILSASLGYQRIEWDGDAFEALEEVTGSVDLAVAVTDTFRFNTFADYNVSEAQAGIGASWALGAGTLDLDYTYVQMDDLSGLADDHRVGVTFSMPLGGGAGAVVASRDRATPGMVTASTQGARRGAALLAEVMRRPEYLPERVVASVATESIQNPVCELSAGIADLQGATSLGGGQGSYDGSVVTAPFNIPNDVYTVYLVSTEILSNNPEGWNVLSLGNSSVSGSSYAVSDEGRSFLDQWWEAEALTVVVFVRENGDCIFDENDGYFAVFNAPLILPE